MIETYGKDTIPKMLDAYRRNESTKDAIPKVFGVTVEEFETGYRNFLKKLVTEIQGGVPEEKQTLAELEKAYEANPKMPKTAGRYAEALLERSQMDRGERDRREGDRIR